VDTNGDWLLDAVYRNGSLWTTAIDACANATLSCPRYIQIKTASPAAIAQDFDFGGTPGTYYYFPAIRTDSKGNLVTVFNASSTNPSSLIAYPSVEVSRQLTTEPQTPVLVHAGEAPYDQSNRWGDYSGAGVDPADDKTVWVAGEYGTSLIGSMWSTWIAAVH
jgi:hypothetical protein